MKSTGQLGSAPSRRVPNQRRPQLYDFIFLKSNKPHGNTQFKGQGKLYLMSKSPESINNVEEPSHSCSWHLCLRGRTLRSLHNRVGSNACLVLLQMNLQREKWVIFSQVTQLGRAIAADASCLHVCAWLTIPKLLRFWQPISPCYLEANNTAS